MKIEKITGREILDSRGNPYSRSRRGIGIRHYGTHPFHRVHRPVNTKRLNSATVINIVMAASGCTESSRERQ